MTNVERARIEKAVRGFPATFGLKSFEGTFRISVDASFVDDLGRVQLYTQRLVKTGMGEEEWLDFAKGDEYELARNITAVRCERCFGDRLVEAGSGPERCPVCKGTGVVFG